MSDKPSKPRVARASVVRQIADPLQEDKAEGDKKPKDDAKADSESTAKVETDKSPGSADQTAETPKSRNQQAQQAANEQVLAPVKRLKTKAVKPAAPEQPIPLSPAEPAMTSPAQPPAPTSAASAPPASAPPTVPPTSTATPAPPAPSNPPSPVTPSASVGAPSPLRPLPAASPDASTAKQPAVTMNDLLAPLQTPIQPVEASAQYNLSAIFVAGAVMLLPLVYVALVGLVAVVSIGWLVTGFSQIGSGVGIFIFFRVLPSLFGLVFVFFMIKPLLAPPEHGSVNFSLDREREPALFQFIEHVAAAVGAPPPTRIDVDTDVNASASFRRGMASFFGGDDLVLTIGLPLAGAMNLRELTGVIAHEFGHFTQGSGMRLSYLIRTINYWFERVVTGDAWDARLDYWIDVLPSRLSVIPLMLKVCVFLSRVVLWLLLRIAAFLSSHLSRQMEYDADRHQLRLCGSDSFIQCEYELRFLGRAQVYAFHDLQESWTEGRLSDDWPALIVHNIDFIRRKSEAVESIRREVEESETHWLDTHPSSAERIAMAKKEYCPGTFHVKAPAKVLFRDFGGLCKAVSLDFYRQIISDTIDARNLVPAEELYQEQLANDDAKITLHRFFQGKIIGRYEMFLPPEASQPYDNFATGIRQLRHFREQMLLGLNNLSAAANRFTEADDRMREMAIAIVLCDCGFHIDPDSFKLRKFDRPTILAAKSQAEHVRTMELNRLNEQVQDGRNRMILGLRLLQNSEFTSKIEDAAELRKQTLLYLRIMGAIETTWPKVLRLREAVNMLAALFHFDGDKRLYQQIERISGVCHSTLQQILMETNQTAYPFNHAKGSISVATFLLDEAPKPDEPLEVLGACDEAVNKMTMLYYRLLARMAVAAETVETGIGMEQLPTPKDEDMLSDEEREALGIER